MSQKVVKLHTDNRVTTPDAVGIENSTMIVTLTVTDLKSLIQEAVRAEISPNRDMLLNIEEAAKMLSVGKDWLYDHHKKLPFSRKLAPKVLRFSYQGIQKYLATRKTS